MNDSRKRKSIINIAVSVGYQVFTVLINFLSRTVFIHLLGSGYLGINSLFTNILSILSLAELGVGTAMVYSMYRPLAEHDKLKLASLTQYFKKIYRIIAAVILIIGLLLIPFLPKIINLSAPIPHIEIYFILYLIDTAVSYLCVYKTSILNADQKLYKLKIYRAIFDTLRVVLQIILLLFFENFFAYILVQIICSVITNVYSARVADRDYAYINEKAVLPKEEKIKIWSNIKAMFSYKIGGVILNNTDQLLISIIVSTEVVGLYSNYYMPVKSVMGLTSSVFIAVQASVGNLAVKNNPKKQFEIFKVLDFCSFWIYGFCAVCFAVLLQDFVNIWLGEAYLLSKSLVYIMAGTYYLTGVLYPIWCYRETVGLFQQTKNILFYASVINIVFSIILGKLWGIEGILFATILARVLTNIWFEPYTLFKMYFNKNVSKYFLRHTFQVIVLILCVVFINVVSTQIDFRNTYVNFGFKLALCAVIPNLVFWGLNHKSEEFKYVISNAKKLFARN